jgi:hypothetical protein
MIKYLLLIFFFFKKKKKFKYIYIYISEIALIKKNNRKGGVNFEVV